MKIIIITAAAPPEPIVAGRVHWDIAEFMAKEGNETWLISPYPSRPLSVNYKKNKGIKITRVNNNFFHVNIDSFTYPKYNLFYRIYESLDFGVKSIRYLNRNILDYDLVYVSSWPFVGQLMITILKKNKKAPLIMNVQDLYPESFFTKIKSQIVIRLFNPLYLIDKYIAIKSSHITVISESLKQVYQEKRKIAESKISILYNWQDETEFVKPVPQKKQILDKYNLKMLSDKFIYMYLGNIGPVAEVETIINAFVYLNNKESALLIAGSGTHKEKCRSLAEKLRNESIFFTEVPLGLAPVVEMQSISDILLLPIHPEAANSSVPSKLIAYMFSCKPVLTSANKDSETAKAIKESNCGWITETSEISDWTKIMKLAFESDRISLKGKGRSGFEYALKNYSKREGLSKVNLLFNKILNS